MRYELMQATSRALDRIAVEAQRTSRTPALAAGVAHRGDLLWSGAVGAADLTDRSVPLGVDTQFLIASNTKTFTAAMVMQLRDEGRLGLDDPVDDHLPGSARPGVTVRRLLSHSSGMQREPVTAEFWDTLDVPPADRFVSDWNSSEQVLPPHAACTTATSGMWRSGRSSPTPTGAPGPRACRRGCSTPSGSRTPPCIRVRRPRASTTPRRSPMRPSRSPSSSPASSRPREASPAR